MSWTTDTFVKARYEKKGDTWVEKLLEEQDPDVYSINVAMRDNPSISPEECERQKRLYKPWMWAYRVDGWPSNRAANAYFCMEDLVKWEDEERYSPGIPVQIIEDKVDPEVGTFDGSVSVITEDGLIQPGGALDEAKFPIWRVWEAPREGEKYVLTADVAQGNPKSDPQAASVWKATEPLFTKQVAQLNMVLIKPGDFATQCVCMSNVYGDCLMVPEQNDTGGGMFIQQVRHYKNLYRRQSKTDQEIQEASEKLGWHVDRFNKGPSLSTAYRLLGKMAAVRLPDGEDEHGKARFKNHCPFNSRSSLLEFQSYQEKLLRDKKTGRAKTIWGAMLGSHDDTVMEAVMAFQIITNEFEKLLTCKLKPKVVHPEKDEHYLGKIQGQTPRPFSQYHKQKKLGALRQASGASYGGSE